MPRVEKVDAAGRIMKRHSSDGDHARMPWPRLRGVTAPPPETTLEHEQQLEVFTAELAAKWEAEAWAKLKLQTDEKRQEGFEQ